MEKIKPYLNTIVTVIGFIIVIVMLSNKKPIEVHIPAVEALEAVNTHTKEIITNNKNEVVRIENSTNYKELRKFLDSAITYKDTSGLVALKCFELVVVQDTIIAKQKDIIANQDKVINNDSIIKYQLNSVINKKEDEITQEKKKSVRNLWKGRIQGVVTGAVAGYVAGKAL